MSTDDLPPSSDCGDEDPKDVDQMFVWGTNIRVDDTKTAIVRFLKNFSDNPSQIEGKYMVPIHQILELDGGGGSGSGSLDIDAQDIFAYDQDLYNKMVRYPLEVLAIFDIVLIDMVETLNRLFEKHIPTRIFNLKTSVSMRNLNPSGKVATLHFDWFCYGCKHVW